jgi:hypothetical protein
MYRLLRVNKTILYYYKATLLIGGAQDDELDPTTLKQRDIKK